jgi:predicted SprT family Zn-dependent metalloprotease
VELRDAYDMALRLVYVHGLDGWAVAFDSAKRRAGVCRYEKQTIGLSAPLTRLHDEAEVRETILHEIAHALVGPEHGHDETWRRTAVSIGCTGLRCVPADAPRVAGVWMGVCPVGHATDRHRRPERVLLCSACEERPIKERIFEWTYHGRPASMHPNYEQELQRLLEGRPLQRLRVGDLVRITADGPYRGRRGQIRHVGRTRYRVALDEGVLKVVFSAVEPASDVPSTAPNRPDAAGGERVQPIAQPVSLSLVTTDGRVSAEDAAGRRRELLIPAKQLMELIEEDSVATTPSATEARFERHVYFLVEQDRRLIVPRTLEPTSPDDATVLHARFSRSERDDADWLGADEYVSCLCNLAHSRGRRLLLQSVRSGLNVRLETGRLSNGRETIQVAADRPIQAHEVWRRASRLGSRFVLESPLSPESVAAAGRLAMVAFGSSGDNPLDVFPGFATPA